MNVQTLPTSFLGRRRARVIDDTNSPPNGDKPERVGVVFTGIIAYVIGSILMVLVPDHMEILGKIVMLGSFVFFYTWRYFINRRGLKEFNVHHKYDEGKPA